MVQLRNLLGFELSTSKSDTPRFRLLDLDTVESALPFIAAEGVSKVARSPRGFVSAYRRAEGKHANLKNMIDKFSGQNWSSRRDGFVARHRAQLKKGGWAKGTPTRQHWALVAWAYSPTPTRLKKWIRENAPTIRIGNPHRPTTALKRIKSALRKVPRKKGQHPADDLCYPASEAFYHAVGGKAAGYTPMQIRHEGESHWWVRGPQGEVYDLTEGQFRTAVPHGKSRGKGFLTAKPSERAQDLLALSGLRANPPKRNPELSIPHQNVIASIVRPMFESSVRIFPNLPNIRIVLRWDAGTHGREFAYFDPTEKVIAVSPRLLREPMGRIIGVLRHELGHVIHESVGRHGLLQHLGTLAFSDEVLADQVAEFVWGSPIFYDSEDVQTVDPMMMHSRVRPSYLPNPQIDLFTGKEIELDEPIDRSTMKQWAESVPKVEIEPSVDYPKGEPYGAVPWHGPALFDETEHFYLRPYFPKREPTPNVLFHRRTGAKVSTSGHPFIAKLALHVASSLGDIPVKKDMSDSGSREAQKWIREYRKKMYQFKLATECADCDSRPGVPCQRKGECRPGALWSEPHISRVKASEVLLDDPEFRIEDIPGFA